MAISIKKITEMVVAQSLQGDEPLPAGSCILNDTTGDSLTIYSYVAIM